MVKERQRDGEKTVVSRRCVNPFSSEVSDESSLLNVLEDFVSLGGSSNGGPGGSSVCGSAGSLGVPGVLVVRFSVVNGRSGC